MFNDYNPLREHVSETCCGTSEIEGVTGATEANFIEFVNKYLNDETKHSPISSPYNSKGYVFMFADNQKGNGKEVAKWIKKYNLGTVTGLKRWIKNRSSGNMIKVWLWHYNGARCITKKTTTKTPATTKRKSSSKKTAALFPTSIVY